MAKISKTNKEVDNNAKQEALLKFMKEVNSSNKNR